MVRSGRISNSSKLLCMSSLPVSMKRIPSNTTEKRGNTLFQIITLSVAMKTSGQILSNFELIQASMHVLIAYKYEKDQMINRGENVTTSFFHFKSMGFFSDAQGQPTPESMVGTHRFSNSFKLLCISSLPASMK